MGFFDDISHILGTDGSGGGILGAISHLGQEVGNAFASVDKFVNNSIPGGWGTIGAATLLAVGITSPTLLDASAAGDLDSSVIDTAISNGEVSADQIGALTDSINSLQPLIDDGTITGSQIGTLLSSGYTPSDLTTLTDAGWNGGDLTTIASNGFTPSDLSTLTDSGFTPSNILDIASANTDTPFQVSDLTNMVSQGATPEQVTQLSTSGFNPTSLDNLMQQGYTPSDLTTALDNGASADQIEYLNANGWTSDLNNYLDENGVKLPAEGEGPISQGPISSPVAPGAPVGPTEPVVPQGPLFGGTDVTSLQPVELNGEQGFLGENGQIYNADGTLNSNLTNYYNTDIGGAPNSPVAGPGSGVPPTTIDVTGLPGTVENPPPVGTVLPENTQLATVAQQTDAINGIANGATYDEASNSWVIPKDIAQAAASTGLTTTQVVALGGAAAAVAAVAAGGGAGAGASFTGTAPGGTPSGTPTTTGTTGGTAGTTTGGPTTPGGTPTTPVNPNPVTPNPNPTPGEPTPTNGPAPVHDYSTPYTTPDGTPVDTSGWSASDIAKAIAAGYLLDKIAGPLLSGQYDNGFQNQFFPIPNFNQYGTVNPGVNPGFVEPAPMYNTDQPGIDQYYWGQHGYAQNMADLANLNTNAVNAPATPYGNPNAVNLGQLITPAQMGYPDLQSMAAAQGTANPITGTFSGLPNLSGDIYHNTVQMNTMAPQVPGYSYAFAPQTQAGMATGHGSAQQYGQSLNYNFTPAQLAELTPAPSNALGTGS